MPKSKKRLLSGAEGEDDVGSGADGAPLVWEEG